MDKDFSQMMAEHKVVSKANARVVVGHGGAAKVEYDLGHTAADTDEGDGPTMDFLLRIVNRMDAQVQATYRLNEEFNGVIKMMVSLALICLVRN